MTFEAGGPLLVPEEAPHFEHNHPAIACSLEKSLFRLVAMLLPANKPASILGLKPRTL